MFFLWDPVRTLAKRGHCPGHEKSLALEVCSWFHRNDEKLRSRIVFPGCGCGAYEIVLVRRLEHRFDEVIMMDSEIHHKDRVLWERALKGTKLVVVDSFAGLCSVVGDDFNVVFFHKAKEAVEDPEYERFIDICGKRSGQRKYVHAFHKDGKDCVYSCSWLGNPSL